MTPPANAKQPSPSASAPAQSAMSPALIVTLLALLMGLQPMTTDLYLPALPALRADLQASMASVQLTLSALLLAFGFSQLVWGPVSDRFGRRPVLLCGMALYTVAAFASALAQNMTGLIVWRALQGAAMGAGVMAARAIVRDLYTPDVGARVMSKALSGLGVIACLSAPVGGALAHFFSWRVALQTLTVFGLVTGLLMAWRYRETLAHARPDALAPASLLRAWHHILTHHRFWAYSLLSSFSYMGLFTLLGASAFVFIGVFGYSPMGYGALMFFNAFFYLIGTFVCRRLLRKRSVPQTVGLAGGLSLLSALLLVGLAHAGKDQSWYGAWAVIGPMYLYMVAHGIHQPCGQSGAVGPFPAAAGTASALNGFLMMLGAFAVGSWLGANLDGTVFPMVHSMGLWATLIALTAWTLVRRHG